MEGRREKWEYLCEMGNCLLLGASLSPLLLRDDGLSFALLIFCVYTW